MMTTVPDHAAGIRGDTMNGRVDIGSTSGLTKPAYFSSGANMDERAIKNIVEGVLKNVLSQMEAQKGSHTAGQAYEAPCCEGGDAPIPVELSARHVHLSEKDAIALFGAPLTHARDLSQPGQFLAKERVRLIGPKGVMDNVAVLGPSRGSSQVEISKTDARILGIEAPVRQSGDTKGTPGIILASLTGIVGLEEGVIVASRHIHMSPEDAKKHCVADNDLVSVRIDGDRPLVLEDVLIRVNEQFSLAMHIDPDEGNSSGWNSKVTGRIICRKNGASHGLCKH
ncbi:phosphate propanoyltransferase [Desulfovibrio mangrovi]|uniref:phosphate propanoyltransferase n=1 Tax=Desulfovibrio mangrovi TaxID=2976983 RepID=UPI0022474079|nr:phosphate propanoyltransferase [Desulfovibrio mangrovi]UZP66778.1 phosphate propanoyltransferase [Desulfovibrio mangrovi]